MSKQHRRAIWISVPRNDGKLIIRVETEGMELTVEHIHRVIEYLNIAAEDLKAEQATADPMGSWSARHVDPEGPSEIELGTALVRAAQGGSED